MIDKADFYHGAALAAALDNARCIDIARWPPGYLESAKKSGVEGWRLAADTNQGGSRALAFGLSQDAVDGSFPDAYPGRRSHRVPHAG